MPSKIISKDYEPEIVATGQYLPSNIIANEDFKQFPENSIELIQIKTGIKARRFASADECTSDLAFKAALNCLSKLNIDPTAIEAIILATSTPDRIQPATATRVQHLLQACNAFAFDINSACSGSVYGLAAADSFIKSGFCKNVLFLAAELYSRFLDPNDFSTYPYFGDGAGAVFMQGSLTKKSFIRSLLKTDGSGAEIIQIAMGGSMLPFCGHQSGFKMYFEMKGKQVYDFAVVKVPEVINEILQRGKIAKDKIKYVIAHQANINIIKEIAGRTGIGMDKFFINLDKYGNTAAASGLIALDELFLNGKISKGDIILIVAFGGGLSWGASLITV